MKKINFLVIFAILMMLASSAYAGSAATPNDRFTNIGSIANTRHNMSQDTAPLIKSDMDLYRNSYGEVCVYCHTPHGANKTIKAPLWNRTIRATAYNTYDSLGTSTLTQNVVQPGGPSLTCLSCHDGQTAIDSIINMPGSGRGLVSQETTQSKAFLDAWTQVPVGASPARNHLGLNSSDGLNGYIVGNGTGGSSACNPGDPECVEVYPGAGFYFQPGQGCLSCHSNVGSGPSAGIAVDFRMFMIGTDLRNDHPVGVTFPTTNGPGTDFNKPNGVQLGSTYFESIPNGRMDKEEIRTYDGKIECASCHDPHGVPSAGPGTVFNKTFLCKQNTDGSAVCLTCHSK